MRKAEGKKDRRQAKIRELREGLINIQICLLKNYIGVVAGLAADGRQIVGRTKSEANNYESLHGPSNTTNLKNVQEVELSQPNNKLMKLRSN
ncbi:hypothetical protein L3X38_006242 [Prunus dulcis]|uniref:Uncharacterized protein n=1 Tax=Prunus dulcis TaxID=3755 RepID=A0AAD4ZSG0_PRUDU|nr:hypothetical protein L3X38_006242 [Prunus dulcis]